MTKTLEFSTVGRDSKSIILNPPLKVEYETILDENEVFISYDFSLMSYVNLDDLSLEEKADLEKTIWKKIEKDLILAIYSDPISLNSYHWSLRKNLRGRALKLEVLT